MESYLLPKFFQFWKWSTQTFTQILWTVFYEIENNMFSTVFYEIENNMFSTCSYLSIETGVEISPDVNSCSLTLLDYCSDILHWSHLTAFLKCAFTSNRFQSATIPKT